MKNQYYEGKDYFENVKVVHFSKMVYDQNCKRLTIPKSELENTNSSLVRIVFSDFSFMIAKYRNDGKIDGKSKIYDKRKRLIGIGLFENGLLKGPFWIFVNDHQYAYVNFQNGKLGKIPNCPYQRAAYLPASLKGKYP